jgi:hypothetical protein
MTTLLQPHSPAKIESLNHCFELMFEMAAFRKMGSLYDGVFDSLL